MLPHGSVLTKAHPHAAAPVYSIHTFVIDLLPKSYLPHCPLYLRPENIPCSLASNLSVFSVSLPLFPYLCKESVFPCYVGLYRISYRPFQLLLQVSGPFFSCLLHMWGKATCLIVLPKISHYNHNTVLVRQ